MEDFILGITIAAAVLQIILFFKVWAMTNDVRSLREKHAPTSEFYFEMRKLLALGEKEKAKEKLLNWFFKAIKNLNYKNIGHEGLEEKRKSVDVGFMQIKKELEKDFKQIGEELPDNIKNMRSGNEFYELYK